MNVSAKSIADTGASVISEVENATSGALQSGAEAARYAGRQARSLESEVEGFVRENPIASIGGALVVGLLVGLAVKRRTAR